MEDLGDPGYHTWERAVKVPSYFRQTVEKYCRIIIILTMIVKKNSLV